MSKKTSVIYLAIFILLAVLGIEAYMVFGHSRPADPLGELWSGNYTKDRAHWKSEIDRIGVPAAYEEFKKDTAGKTFGVAHTLAHIFGELIYNKEGLTGIGSCDSSFAFGCYHSFFGKAVAEHGPDVVPELDALCVKRWGPKGLGCPHGIGHGILGSLGDDRLDEALSICSKLSWKGVTNGCSSGVFMEFNFHTMQSIKGIEPRIFDPKNPLYPCNKVSLYGESCYFELSPWLSKIFLKDYAKVADVCGVVKNSTERNACYKGIGNSIGPDTMYDAAKSIAACGEISDKNGALMCRAGAAWSFYAEPSAQNRYADVCKGLSPADEQICLKESELVR